MLSIFWGPFMVCQILVSQCFTGMDQEWWRALGFQHGYHRSWGPWGLFALNMPFWMNIFSQFQQKITLTPKCFVILGPDSHVFSSHPQWMTKNWSLLDRTEVQWEGGQLGDTREFKRYHARRLRSLKDNGPQKKMWEHFPTQKGHVMILKNKTATLRNV